MDDETRLIFFDGINFRISSGSNIYTGVSSVLNSPVASSSLQHGPHRHTAPPQDQDVKSTHCPWKTISHAQCRAAQLHAQFCRVHGHHKYLAEHERHAHQHTVGIRIMGANRANRGTLRLHEPRGRHSGREGAWYEASPAVVWQLQERVVHICTYMGKEGRQALSESTHSRGWKQATHC